MLDVKSGSYFIMNFSNEVGCINYRRNKVCSTYGNSFYRIFLSILFYLLGKISSIHGFVVTPHQ